MHFERARALETALSLASEMRCVTRAHIAALTAVWKACFSYRSPPYPPRLALASGDSCGHTHTHTHTQAARVLLQARVDMPRAWLGGTCVCVCVCVCVCDDRAAYLHEEHSIGRWQAHVCCLAPLRHTHTHTHKHTSACAHSKGSYKLQDTACYVVRSCMMHSVPVLRLLSCWVSF